MEKRIYREFSLRRLTIYRYRHSGRFCHLCKDRQTEVLCLANAGKATFYVDGQEFSLAPGEFLYLPVGSSSRASWAGETIDYFTLDFAFVSKLVHHAPPTLDLSEESPYYLAARPFKTENGTLSDMIRSIDSAFRTDAETGGLRAAAQFHRLFQQLLDNGARMAGSRIRPALDAIESDPARSYSQKELAQMCALSPSRFFVLFSEETGMGPVRYRNLLRIEIARRLLTSQCYTVEETAEQLGFSSADYFSRTFKSLTGISPKIYQLQAGLTKPEKSIFHENVKRRP